MSEEICSVWLREREAWWAASEGEELVGELQVGASALEVVGCRWKQ